MSLPAEILQEIFNHLDTSHNGLRTLFSCLLVSRHWCSNTIGILWSKPFYYSNAFVANPNPYKIIDIYLACLDEEAREDLRINGVNLPVIFDKPLFDYASHHKHLYYRTFISCVYLWVQETYPCNGHLFELIMKVLLKLFNERCRKLQTTLYIIETEKGLTTSESKPMFYVQPEHGYLISNVNRIWVDLHVYRPRFFDLLAKNCKKVEQFGVFMKGIYNECGSIDVAKFIIEQEALQSFQSIYLTSTQNVIDALETQANSLRCVDFICTNFHGCGPLDGLAACKNLEVLRFRKCFNITEEIISPLLTASLPKLTYVSIIKTDCDILQKWAESFYLEGEVDDFQDTRIQFDLNHVREVMLNDRICQVCDEPYIYPLTTTCGHTFCKGCILHRLSIYSRCPVCSTVLSSAKYFYEYPCESTDSVTSERRRSDADRRLLQEMPIYVGHLTFPKMTYTFNVTEQKHLLLLRSCYESRYCKKFGMVLSNRCEYGTLMEIKRIDRNNEGDLILQATATDRFKILLNGGIKDGYEVAKVQIIQDEEERSIGGRNLSSNEQTTSQLINIARDFIYGNELVSLTLHLSDLASSLGDLPDNAADFSFYVAFLLPIKEEEKYEILEKRCVNERMQLVVMWINDLRSQWVTLIIKQIQNMFNFYLLYSWFLAFLLDFNHLFYRN